MDPVVTRVNSLRQMFSLATDHFIYLYVNTLEGRCSTNCQLCFCILRNLLVCGTKGFYRTESTDYHKCSAHTQHCAILMPNSCYLIGLTQLPLLAPLPSNGWGPRFETSPATCGGCYTSLFIRKLRKSYLKNFSKRSNYAKTPNWYH